MDQIDDLRDPKLATARKAMRIIGEAGVAAYVLAGYAYDGTGRRREREFIIVVNAPLISRKALKQAGFGPRYQGASQTLTDPDMGIEVVQLVSGCQRAGVTLQVRNTITPEPIFALVSELNEEWRQRDESFAQHECEGDPPDDHEIDFSDIPRITDFSQLNASASRICNCEQGRGGLSGIRPKPQTRRDLKAHDAGRAG